MRKMTLVRRSASRAVVLVVLVIVAGLLFTACRSSGTERITESPLLAQGESWSYVFPSAGTYEIRCSPHGGMLQTITVSGDGSVAAGVTAAQMQDSQFAPQQLEVTAGGSVVWTNRDATRHNVVVNRVVSAG